MASFQEASQVEVRFPDQVVVPTYYSNLVLASVLQDDVYLKFCIRDADRPLARADLQCRVMMSVESLRRLIEGLAQLVRQYEQRMEELRQQQRASS
ncbi:MAG: hypothetical protein KatS3mg102_0038 [Planctomycetota bacterium]|nr:MAG: hypothetical protein KatS3mg102_0038 [Planctomycetota bacterium]